MIIRNLRTVSIQDYPTEIIESLVPRYAPQRLIEKSQDHLMVVCLHENQLVGTASLDGNRIRNVYVHADRHGKGIGRSLLAEIEATARKQHLPRLTLHSALSAQGFYDITSQLLHKLQKSPDVIPTHGGLAALGKVGISGYGKDKA